MFFDLRQFFINMEATITQRGDDDDEGDVGSKMLRQGWRWKNIKGVIKYYTLYSIVV
jgi:hypothetical protein